MNRPLLAHLRHGHPELDSIIYVVFAYNFFMIILPVVWISLTPLTPLTPSSQKKNTNANNVF